MKNIKFIIFGSLFGIVLLKAEVVSWFRIQEMFRFQSFHMYGIIGSAIFVGAISILLIKKLKLKTIAKEGVEFPEPPKNRISPLIGGICFGLGWAIVGACPGPLYAHLGTGNMIIIIPIIFAIIGVIIYGVLKNKLPH